MTKIGICEGCEQEKEVTDVEGSLLCKDCEEDVVRCSFCNRFLAVNFNDLDSNIGTPAVPELSLPDRQTSDLFCDIDCLEKYVQEYQREKRLLEKMKEIKNE
jgi:hypothetical protein